ncbi:hypothetical protein GcC1_129004 [Golovinomyces cichoracearum]|uniref:Uncharacterized protein n=1 Tax=Golovinomyces cichoracearum TaxID=62708 RepID=A0A420I4T4_9PEZI|nr:hypothetical protein GcC1_129004 [Golovinomyces cichoracearum]
MQQDKTDQKLPLKRGDAPRLDQRLSLTTTMHPRVSFGI